MLGQIKPTGKDILAELPNKSGGIGLNVGSRLSNIIPTGKCAVLVAGSLIMNFLGLTISTAVVLL